MSAPRAANAERMRAWRAEKADIGSIPEVDNPDRVERTRYDLKRFCEEYRPDVFCFEWSEDHLRVLEITQRVVLEGGLFALAMPRGGGKTTISVTAAMWALLFGHRKYVCLVGATAGKAEDLLKSIKTEFRFNERLVSDFPQACYPIVCLEGKATRANGQTSNGHPTNMQWLADKLVLPTLQGAPSSGAVISVAGITGDIRGQQHTQPAGGIIRPDIVIVDDPQTRESASSPTQTDQRIRIIQGDILGLAGPTTKISCLMPCTVIRRYDLADRILSKDDFLDWKSVKTQLLYGVSKHPELWDAYKELRDEALQNDLDSTSYTDFYRQNQEKMDEGLTAGWVHRFNPDEVSAIQHAMNLQFRDIESYLAEYQNEPTEHQDEEGLRADDILSNQHHCHPGVVPMDVQKLVAFADVQKECLFWTICGFRDDFTGYIIDYGHFPEQKDKNVPLKNLRNQLTKLYPDATLEHRLKEAMNGLGALILDSKFVREDGVELSISRMLIDANWGQSRDIVYNWCRTSKWNTIVTPSHGRFVGASSQPLNAGKTSRSGCRIGTHWRIETSKEMPVRYALYDANMWKSYAVARLRCSSGSPGALSLPKASPRDHKAFADNLCAEYPIRVEGRGRTVDEWKCRPGADNHWFDCVVGCCVAANMEGIRMRSEQKREAPVQQRTRPKEAILL